jgi:hypothetical protein
LISATASSTAALAEMEERSVKREEGGGNVA